MTFFMDPENPEGRAAALIHDFDGDSERSSSVEFMAGHPQEIHAQSGVLITAAGNGEGVSATSYGAGDYINCLAYCVGANCSAQAYRCRHLRLMYAVLACMTAACGPKVRTCHSICKNRW